MKTAFCWSKKVTFELKKELFFQKGEQINVLLQRFQYTRCESTLEKQLFLRWNDYFSKKASKSMSVFDESTQEKRLFLQLWHSTAGFFAGGGKGGGHFERLDSWKNLSISLKREAISFLKDSKGKMSFSVRMIINLTTRRKMHGVFSKTGIERIKRDSAIF